ncbi:MAG TPA: DNA replication and repair protein RecF, partial [Marinagarivorans sp.]
HGRSFRTVNYRQLIQHGEPSMSVFAETDYQGVSSRIGVLRPLRGSSTFKIDGSPVYSSASLATLLPLQVMNSKSFDLFEGPAKVRRRMFDWLVFHVKHEFSQLWRDYTKAVKQRNSLLRRDKISSAELAPWDTELNRLGISIDALRQECLEPFMAKVKQLIPDINLPAEYTVDVEYQRGWQDGITLAEALKNAFPKDRKYGYSTCGAHKSELKVLINRQPAAEVLSRGQQKSLVAAFLLAELQIFEEVIGKPSVLLIDDLPAELDRQHIQSLAQWLLMLNTQVLVTGIYAADMEVLKNKMNNKPCKVFHVKHGEINECNP